MYIYINILYIYTHVYQTDRKLKFHTTTTLHATPHYKPLISQNHHIHHTLNQGDNYCC